MGLDVQRRNFQFVHLFSCKTQRWVYSPLVMQNNISTAAALMGSARTEAKAAAARSNGAKGGRPVTWHKAPARGCTNTIAELYKFTVVRNSDGAERFTDRRPRPEVIKSADFTVWNNRENCEER